MDEQRVWYSPEEAKAMPRSAAPYGWMAEVAPAVLPPPSLGWQSVRPHKPYIEATGAVIPIRLRPATKEEAEQASADDPAPCRPVKWWAGDSPKGG